MNLKRILCFILLAAFLSTSAFSQTSRSGTTGNIPSTGFFPTSCQLGTGTDCSARGGGFFTDESAFIAAIEPGFYQEAFDGVAFGSAPSLDFTDGTFSYTVTSFNSGGSDDLFNDPGSVSTNLASSSLLFSFTGAPVFAVGGTVYTTDINFLPTNTTIVLTLDDGTQQTISSTDLSSFGGFTSPVPIVSMTVDAPDDDLVQAPQWPTVGDLIVGTLPVESLPESQPVPTLSKTGLIIMIALMLLAGWVLTMRRA